MPGELSEETKESQIVFEQVLQAPIYLVKYFIVVAVYQLQLEKVF